MEIKNKLTDDGFYLSVTQRADHILFKHFIQCPTYLSIYTIDCFCRLITNQLHYIGAGNLSWLYDPPPEPDPDLDGK